MGKSPAQLCSGWDPLLSHGCVSITLQGCGGTRASAAMWPRECPVSSPQCWDDQTIFWPVLIQGCWGPTQVLRLTAISPALQSPPKSDSSCLPNLRTGQAPIFFLPQMQGRSALTSPPSSAQLSWLFTCMEVWDRAAMLSYLHQCDSEKETDFRQVGEAFRSPGIWTSLSLA